jgi:hypothetical protein
MEAIMRNSSITRLVIRTAVAVGLSVIAVSAIGCAVAQPPVEATEFSSQKALTNRSPLSQADFRLTDHQQLRGYFLDGSRDRLR